MTDLAELISYHRWATGRVLNAVQALGPEDFARDLGSSHGGVRGTLAHLLGADVTWATRLLGEAAPPLPEPASVPDAAALRGPWWAVLDAYEGLLSRLEPQSTVRYRNSRGDAYENTVSDVIRHVVNHGTHHRGQVVTMLRQLGATAPNTDLIAFYRQRRG